MASKQMYWTDAHFCGLQSQTNVYALSKITLHDGLTRLLAVSINGHFVTVEYQKSFDNRLIPITREGEFFVAGSSPLHGPGGVGDMEIVSVDMICENKERKGIILAITYLFKFAAPYEEKAPSPYMNIYYLTAEDNSYINLVDAIAMSQMQALMLEYFPLKLTHYLLTLEDGKTETCFLLSGNDSKVHVLRLTVNPQTCDEDLSIADKYFPELLEVTECVTQLELKEVYKTHRLTAVGTQSGQVNLYLVNTSSLQIEQRWETSMDSPITSIQLFSHQVKAPPPDFIKDFAQVKETSVTSESETDQPINLLITSAIDPAFVFCDVMENDLNKRHILPRSNSQDVVLCSCIMDIDFDGENEILIGTYGQVLMAYKMSPDRTPGMLMTSTPFHSPRPVPVGTSKSDLSTASHISEDKSLHTDQNQTDRRRHKSIAGTMESGCSPHKHDRHHEWHRSDESSGLEGQGLRDAQMARLVRSQENLACASPRSVYFQTPELSDSYEMLPQGLFGDLQEGPSYRLKWTKRFSYPVMGLTCEDMMGDGMLDLVVLTLKGLHILQPDLNEVAGLLLDRLKSLCEPSEDKGETMNNQEKQNAEEQIVTRNRTGAITERDESHSLSRDRTSAIIAHENR